MAKKKSKKKGFALSLSVLVALVCALVMVVAYFLPFQVIKTETILTEEDTTTSNGIAFTEALFEGENQDLKEANKDNDDYKEYCFGKYTACFSAFACIVLGGLLLLGLLAQVVLKNGMLLNICKLVALVSVVVSILGIIGSFIYANKFALDVTILVSIASSKAFVGISSYLYLVASLVGAGSLLLLKK